MKWFIRLFLGMALRRSGILLGFTIATVIANHKQLLPSYAYGKYGMWKLCGGYALGYLFVIFICSLVQFSELRDEVDW